MKRLVCVVEGRGEVVAIPNLCARIILYLGAEGWFVDQNPVHQPRSRIVDESQKSPRRGAHPDLARACELARRRPADAVLVVCDADDDCPATWAIDAAQRVTRSGPIGFVMAVREFETWLLWNESDQRRAAAGVADPESKRDAKKYLAKLVPGYMPSTHQLAATRKLRIETVRARSASFDKAVRTVAGLIGVVAPPRGG